MKKRTLPYGYEIRNGKICLNAEESGTVRKLFQRYADGASFQELALWIQAEGIPYCEGGGAWNKNKVARIINSTTYIGTDAYPALIDQELYEQASARKPKCGMTEKGLEAKAVREMSRCANCSGTLRMTAIRQRRTRWVCTGCGILNAGASTEKIMRQVEAIFQSLLRGDCAVVELPTKPEYEQHMPEQSAFDAIMEAESFDETAAIHKALELAASRFDRIGSEDYETRRIRRILEQAQKDDGLDVALLREIASMILIQPGGGVVIQLKNGQMIGRDDAL